MSDSLITEKWPEIEQRYLTAPTDYGLVKRIATDLGLPYDTLRQRIWQSGLREEKAKLRNKLPIKQKLRDELSTAIAVAAVKPLAKRLEEGWEKHSELMIKHQEKLHTDLERFSEAEPFEFDKRLKVADALDELARKTFGMKGTDDVDPQKRGIAFLIGGFEPKPAQGRVIES